MSTPIQQQETLQVHWEKTARTTPETEVVVEPVEVVSMAVLLVTQDREMRAVLAVSQDPTTRPVAQKTMDRE